jgi:crotonobetainyl-CoA:carnitine CoA-transferase CaiB-like acyl-CoA transferase
MILGDLGADVIKAEDVGRPPSVLGHDTDAVLAGAGITSAEIARLRDERIVR